MFAAKTLLSMGVCDRDIYLYDTFCRMTSTPTDRDIDWLSGKLAKDGGGHHRGKRMVGRPPVDVSVAGVQKKVYSTGYPKEHFFFVKGFVEDTLPDTMPEAVSILRLDTDFYTSTYHELTHLFPRLSPGGVLIIDDYGHWKGSKDATDQYLKEQSIPMLLQRVDYTGRMGIKLALAEKL